MSVANADLTEGLVAYWMFDDGTGTTAVDSVGGHHGTLVGGPLWTPPGDFKIGTGALHFDGADDVVSIEPFDVIGGGITLAAWMKPDSFGINDGRVISKANEWGANDHWWMLSTIASGGEMRLRFRLKTNDGQGVPTLIASSGELVVGEWHHWAATWDGTTMRLYSNTLEAGSMAKGGTAVARDPTVSVAIGSQPPDAFAPATPDHVVKYFHGVIDDVGVWNRALTPAELQTLWGDGAGTAVVKLAKASSPYPQNEAIDVPRDAVLGWTPGIYAPPVNGHRVYFGESFNDVNDGVGGTTQDANSYTPAQRLDFETTYYWRVDEVNAPPDSTVFPGEVWSFTTEPVGYPIDGASITATASSVGQADFGPEKTVDGSGLDDNGLHSVEPTDMWLSGTEPQGAWIQYELDKVYKLHKMWIWNSNQIFEGLFGFGMKDVTVEYSTNGADWTVLADVPEFTKAPGAAGYAHDTTVDFGGAAAKYVRLTATSNWGGVLPQYGLSEVRFFSIPVSAREPSPGSGAADVDVETTFSWRAGREAATHDVYLSTDEQAVIDGSVPAVSVTDASYSSALELGSTYYWRIDEVNEAETPTTWKGDVWSFSTPEYLVVDDFESYNDIDPPDPKSNRIFESWSDGYNVATNGALIGHDPPQPSYTETTIVHGGDQSLPLFYNNTGGAAYSEAARAFAVPQDWTKYGVKTLVLYFHGAAGNAGGQLYVKINGMKVPFNGDAGALNKPWWTQWNIDLASTGANLQNVTEFGIGVDGAGAAGTFYIDDIVLYRLAPEAVVPQGPGSENLVAYYAMESNGADSSGRGNNGTPIGSPAYAPGIAGMAMDFDGLDDWLDLGTLDVVGGGITLSMWVNPESYMFNDTRTISKATGTGSDDHLWMLSTNGANHVLRFRLKTDEGQSTTTLIADSGDILEGEWTHAAATWDGSTMRLYRNLELVGSTAKGGTAVAVDPTVGAAVGNQPAGAGDKHWVGLIDEVKIYSRGLTAGELRYIASGP
jgi:hypothetical protein